ncbi:MAG TPA: DUF488 domain-containing protein [Deferrimonas sp.]
MQIRLKRAYEEASKQDGCRVLVDRIWPRGVSKEGAKIDLWLKEIAPSDGLRKWFGHDPAKWEEFRKRYFAELDERAESLEELREKAGDGRLTLVFGARDEEHNNAVALKDFLEKRKSS